METTSLKCYSLPYSEFRTWGIAALFVAGNILLPQLFHLLPEGGITWLPIYLFTLVGAYKYGWKVGLLTAIISPCINTLLFGMPTMAILPAILIKSTLLALAAGWAAAHWQRATLWQLALVVALYQGIGSLIEWGITGDFSMATRDLTLGIPGMMLQIFGGWFILNRIIRR